MKIIDISRKLQDAPVYPGDENAEIRRLHSMEDGEAWNASAITMGSHSGTHADAFSHFLADGAAIDEMSLDAFCGPCRVLSVSAEELIRQDDLRGRLAGVERIALHTGGNAFLCEQAASYLAECGVKLLVTDAVSVAPADNEAAIHGLLFSGGVAVVENADLSAAPDGEYLIFAFPMKIGGCDGAPVRAVLLRADLPEDAENEEASAQESAEETGEEQPEGEETAE